MNPLITTPVVSIASTKNFAASITGYIFVAADSIFTVSQQIACTAWGRFSVIHIQNISDKALANINIAIVSNVSELIGVVSYDFNGHLDIINSVLHCHIHYMNQNETIKIAYSINDFCNRHNLIRNFVKFTSFDAIAPDGNIDGVFDNDAPVGNEDIYPLKNEAIATTENRTAKSDTLLIVAIPPDDTTIGQLPLSIIKNMENIPILTGSKKIEYTVTLKAPNYGSTENPIYIGVDDLTLTEVFDPCIFPIPSPKNDWASTIIKTANKIMLQFTGINIPSNESGVTLHISALFDYPCFLEHGSNQVKEESIWTMHY